MGDFGSATGAMRIIDLFALQVFAKNLDRCNFRLLQHYLPRGDIQQTKYDGVKELSTAGVTCLDADRLGQFVLNRGGPLAAARLPTWQNPFPCETVAGLRGRRRVGRDREGTFSPSIAVLQCVDHPARDWQMPLATP